ncbi:MAG: hypothetical protein A2W36_03890 [Chloroflexi bacterium RBG_16_58_14]|nr:MAG: hypothetical protein A2W36_03890 [Chloroflexi bacterium RBG_16_58_14]
MNDLNPPGLDSEVIATSGDALSQLSLEYDSVQERMALQPPLLQRYLETVAASLAESLVQGLPQAHFKLPDRAVVQAVGAGKPHTLLLPEEQREQMVGGFMGRVTRSDLRTALRQRLLELEQHQDPAVAASAALLRYAIVTHLVYNMLPSGRTVTYIAAEGEEIASLPVADELEPESAITASTDAIVEEGASEDGRGELLVPYVPYARRFYLPQWVAFDGHDQMVVNSISEAEAHIASMQRYLFILHASVGIASYMVADSVYQQKRYGMMGQLVNQGRALARYEVRQIIQTIQRRAAAQDLNRGLSLSLPYFNEQDLAIVTYDFEVIPSGRIMFVKAFVVRAAREQQAKIAQDTRLSPTTRKHLIEELQMLERAFL